MQAIGIDIGTTAISAVLLDGETGALLGRRSQNSNAFLSGAPYERIQDVERIMQIATALLEGFFSPKVSVIGITGQMHGILYYGREGEALSPLYTWQDKRGDLEESGRESCSKRLGLPSGYGTVTDLYNKEHGLVPLGAVGFTTVHSYFAMRLTGRRHPLLHSSDAASLGRVHPQSAKPQFDFEGEITGEFATVGRYRGVPVSVPVGDNQAGVLGSLRSEEDVLLNVGTGSQISLVTKAPLCRAGIEWRPFVKDRFLAVGAALCGGRAYAMLERLCREMLRLAGAERDAYPLLDTLPLPEGAPLADTRFGGTRTDPDLTGSIVGLTENNFTLPHLRRAILEGIVGELYEMLPEAKAAGGALVGSGNGLRKNPALRRLAEERFGKPLLMPLYPEEASVGAALFGLVATGYPGGVDGVRGLLRYESDTRQ